jgi:hypothetical protein
MKSRTKYTDEPLAMEVVEDFLPPPEELVLKTGHGEGDHWPEQADD